MDDLIKTTKKGTGNPCTFIDCLEFESEKAYETGIFCQVAINKDQQCNECSRDDKRKDNPFIK